MVVCTSALGAWKKMVRQGVGKKLIQKPAGASTDMKMGPGKDVIGNYE